jgi:hypothetical protein
MLDNLRSIDPDAIGKVQCFEADVRDVDVADIKIRPTIAFIDGEHTRKATNSDFDFCSRVVATDGVVMFHDFWIIYKAVFDALRRLGQRDYLAFLIEGNVFGIFLDPALVRNDDYLAVKYREHRNYQQWLVAKRTASRFTPSPVKWMYRTMRATLHNHSS